MLVAPAIKPLPRQRSTGPLAEGERKRPSRCMSPAPTNSPNGSPRGILGIASLGIGVKDKDQLVHRQPGRVFI